MPDSLSHHNPKDSSTTFNCYFPEKQEIQNKVQDLREIVQESFDWEKGLTPQPREISQDVWQFPIVLVSLIVITTAKFAYPQRLQQWFSSFALSRYMKGLMREELALSSPFSLLLLTNYALTTGMVLFNLFELKNIDLVQIIGGKPSDLNQLLILSGLVLGWTLIKQAISFFLEFLIGSDGGQSENRHNTLVFSQITGIFLLPLLIFSNFSSGWLAETAFVISIAVFPMIYLFRLLRGVLSGIEAGVNLLIIILYLCALEILPLLVIIRWLGFIG